MKEAKFECYGCKINCQFIASEFDSEEGTKTTEYRCPTCSTRYQITLKGTMLVKRVIMRDGQILEYYKPNVENKATS
jgi:hypothetical protein